MRGIDRGIDLRRRKARMAQQFLQTPQIRPARQQVRRETVAQRVRRSPFGQTQRAPRRAHARPDDARLERSRARAEADRKSDVEGKRVSVRVELGCRRIHKTKKIKTHTRKQSKKKKDKK